jgi:hypothetical protein
MDEALVGIILGIILCSLLFLPNVTADSTWEEYAITRGYALYCPDTGDFAWKGECKNE